MSVKHVKIIRQSFPVAFDYPVFFTRGVFEPGRGLLAGVAGRLGEKRRHRVSVFVDAGVAGSHRGLLKKIERHFKAHAERLQLAAPPQVVPGGEAIKADGPFLMGLLHSMAEQRLSRHCFALIIGGGAALDAVGFAASLLHRGLRVIRMPATALSQCDSGVGVKTSVNWEGKKNLLGTFAPPFAVINDFDFLDTLPDAEWSAGIAEAFKVALIKDRAFFDFLRGNAARLRARDRGALERMIIRCAELHLDHIRTSGDPFEYGRARPLDFGHWAAHKLESMSGYRIGHGPAVAAGLAVDTLYAASQKWITASEREQIMEALRAAGLRLWYDELERKDRRGRLEILAGLQDFREHLGGELCVTFPRGIGRKREVHAISAAAMTKAIYALKKASAG